MTFKSVIRYGILSVWAASCSSAEYSSNNSKIMTGFKKTDLLCFKNVEINRSGEAANKTNNKVKTILNQYTNILISVVKESDFNSIAIQNALECKFILQPTLNSVRDGNLGAQLVWDIEDEYLNTTFQVYSRDSKELHEVGEFSTNARSGNSWYSRVASSDQSRMKDSAKAVVEYLNSQL